MTHRLKFQHSIDDVECTVIGEYAEATYRVNDCPGMPEAFRIESVENTATGEEITTPMVDRDTQRDIVLTGIEKGREWVEDQYDRSEAAREDADDKRIQDRRDETL